MVFSSLSVVSPAGDWIREGRKTIEVRSWQPAFPVFRDLLIVQNRRRLNPLSLPSDSEGEAVALTDVIRVRPWLPTDLAASCSPVWTEGYFAWELARIRPLPRGIPAVAKLGIYPVDLPSDALGQG